MMVALPWWLLASGIVLMIIGFMLGSLTPPTTRQKLIDPRLRDDEIARNLRGAEGSRLASLVLLLGGMLIVVSLVWRLVLMLAGR